ncbi:MULTISPECIES: LCP family protein [Frankia]|uniref:Transcriptional regulator n=1 Tax=Frankia alni (strain DSM 45986 / CECT 9034 / ACN14a) TaxID=326424 RepID=Q0RRD4_FRAAA|nr:MULTISPECIES: LCP family protein [Frankia]CAJ59886.1 Putative transcriptional regulator [Frankia alni ACN14a]
MTGLLSVLVLALSSLGWAAYRHFDGAITRVNWNIDGARPAGAAGEENILLLGDDSREGTDGEYGVVDGVRSDTTIIAHFARDGSATLLSFPRDMLVPVVPPERAEARDGRAKLTEVLQLADVPGLVTTLESLTGLKIDHTISINLAGFRTMTDAVGGVTVCVTPLPDGSTRNLHDAMSGWNGHLGENRLNGEQALAFVRTRYALGDERLRVLRQQQFLAKLLATATGAGVLTNPAKITALLGAVGGALRVDAGLDQTALLTLAKRASGLSSGGVRFVTVPTRVALPADGAVDGMGTVPPHGAVLVADQAGLAQVLAPLRPAGTTRPATAPPPEPAGTAAGPAGTTISPADIGVRPADVSVGSAGVSVGPAGVSVGPADVSVAAVRNASGRTGLAAATVDALRSLGFTGAMTTATTTGQEPTEIHYPPGHQAAARTLAARLPGALPVEDPARVGDGLVVVLGTAFAGLAAATPAAPGSVGTGAVPTTTGSGTVGTATPAPVNTSCTP